MGHNCDTCKYYYKYKGQDSETVYQPLIDGYVKLTADKQLPACGYDPGGVVLDDDAPRCRHYENKLDK